MKSPCCVCETTFNVSTNWPIFKEFTTNVTPLEDTPSE